MWPLVLFLLLSASSSFAESGFPEKYERDHNFFKPAKLFSPDNPLNPAQNYSASDDSSNPAYRYDQSNPTNPANRFIPSNPFNPANEHNPQSALNPANEYNPGMPFQPLNRSRKQRVGLAEYGSGTRCARRMRLQSSL